jgi:type II secretory pathway pseudopilin PulG
MSIITNNKRGQLAVELLFLAAIVITLVGGFVSLAASFLNLSVRSQNEAQAVAIAEAGIEYYKWHLAYAPQDFMDGTGKPGPYVHTYYNKNGTAIGQFSLNIVPPPSGSTIVTITSTGSVLADSTIKKIITVRLGVPSFAQYAWVLNSPVAFGSTAQVYGVIYSNSGIEFNGVAHNLVESALTTYSDPDNGNLNEWAVYTEDPPADPQPPTPLPSQPNVFLAGRTIGVPAIDFAGITEDLATIEAAAQATGYYATGSRALGYDLLLSSTTFTVYKVTATTTPPRNCTNDANQPDWGTWSIQSESLYATGTIPQNGDMFFSDNLWVRGNVNGVRVTIASGRFPANPTTYSNITVNNSLTYTNFNGSDTIALVSQNNINVGYAADNNLTIDAALIAQNGWVGRYYYNSNCGSSYTRNSLTTLGIMATNLPSGFVYTPTSGFANRTYNYDANLLYSPPPSFPLTTNGYTLISWEEVQ